jgi:hypothetical protein
MPAVGPSTMRATEVVGVGDPCHVVSGTKGTFFLHHGGRGIKDAVALTSFYVENYRAFRDETKIELRPLTLFFGYNNCGKSSLVRFLPLLANSFSPTAGGPLSLSSSTLRGASFPDIVHMRPSIEPLQFGLEGKTSGGFPYKLEYQINYFQKYRLVYIQSLKVTSGNQCLYAATFVPSEGISGVPSRAQVYDVEGLGTPLHQQPLKFGGLVPHNGANLPDGVQSVFDDLVGSLGQNSVLWLDALRALPARRYQTTGEQPSNLAHDGQNAPLFLIYDSLLPGGSLLKNVSTWFEKESQLKLVIGSDISDFSVFLESSKSDSSPKQVNLCDSGEGIGQVLPVVIAAELAKQRKSQQVILALEQPEIHLHPAMQGAVAQLLASVASGDPEVRVLLETHSHEFLLQIQLEILAGRLRSDDVAVHWVQQDGYGVSRVNTIFFDVLAKPIGPWPPGVFSEGVEKARKIAITRLERSHALSR